MNVEIVRFSKTWDRTGFSCGQSILDEWLMRQASQQERSGNTRTFLAVDTESEEVLGYYSSTTYRLELDEAAKAYGLGKRRYPVPVDCSFMLWKSPRRRVAVTAVRSSWCTP